MADNFKECLEIILKNEGGFVDHPKDPGGMTNLGVTRGTYEQFLGRHVTEEEMRNLTPEDVAPVYKEEYWDRCRCNDLDNGLALFTFDWAVNAGSSRPAKCIQKFVSAKQDGVIGAKTLGLVAEKAPKDIIEYMFDSRQKHYESLSTFDTFGKGGGVAHHAGLAFAFASSACPPPTLLSLPSGRQNMEQGIYLARLLKCTLAGYTRVIESLMKNEHDFLMKIRAKVESQNALHTKI